MNPTMIEVEELSSTNNHGSSPCGTGNPTAAVLVHSAAKDTNGKRKQRQANIFSKYQNKLLRLSTLEINELWNLNYPQFEKDEHDDASSYNAATVDTLADAMAFGVFQPCPQCKKQILYKSRLASYSCTGSRPPGECRGFGRNPERPKLTIPPELETKYQFLSDYQSEMGTAELVGVFPTRCVTTVDPNSSCKDVFPRNFTGSLVICGICIVVGLWLLWIFSDLL